VSDVAYIARCPVHGLHGKRLQCFTCGGPVEQVAMIPASEHEHRERPPAEWVALANQIDDSIDLIDLEHAAMLLARLIHQAGSAAQGSAGTRAGRPASKEQ
jgi:hypothetical protein